MADPENRLRAAADPGSFRGKSAGVVAECSKPIGREKSEPAFFSGLQLLPRSYTIDGAVYGRRTRDNDRPLWMMIHDMCSSFRHLPKRSSIASNGYGGIPESDLGAYFSCPHWQQKENE